MTGPEVGNSFKHRNKKLQSDKWFWSQWNPMIPSSFGAVSTSFPPYSQSSFGAQLNRKFYFTSSSTYEEPDFNSIKMHPIKPISAFFLSPAISTLPYFEETLRYEHQNSWKDKSLSFTPGLLTKGRQEPTTGLCRTGKQKTSLPSSTCTAVWIKAYRALRLALSIFGSPGDLHFWLSPDSAS